MGCVDEFFSGHVVFEVLEDPGEETSDLELGRERRCPARSYPSRHGSRTCGKGSKRRERGERMFSIHLLIPPMSV